MTLYFIGLTSDTLMLCRMPGVGPETWSRQRRMEGRKKREEEAQKENEEEEKEEKEKLWFPKFCT